MKHTSTFIDNEGRTIGHVVQPEDRHRIKCNGKHALHECNERAMFCRHPAHGGPPYMYQCLECSPLPELFASGQISAVIQKRGTDTLYVARFLEHEFKYTGSVIEFRTHKTGRFSQAYKHDHTGAVNYVWGLAQTEGL